ncbi:hypothetical protein PsorP6_004062 [Peronosclerospora sorghi]|uniref:Uncharacterized protein n=1 Tax=Peronosclerospora sorghi TaxID=230839 RepID=A0ACC0VQ42_9STRA|nr:hypothetical protein PsorP6_004062 [Peronosclerospora sorghi]
MLALLSDSSAVTVETSQEEGFDRAGREAKLIRLLTKLNKTTYNHEACVIKEKMNRAAVLLYKDMGDISRAISSYLADEDHEYQMNAFSYIRTETDKEVDGEEMEMRDSSNGNEPPRRRRKSIEGAFLDHAPALMKTDGYAFLYYSIRIFF